MDALSRGIREIALFERWPGTDRQPEDPVSAQITAGALQ